jgi:Cu2+-exporting ATPase
MAQSSRHPLSQAVRRALVHQGIAAATIADVVEEAGFGVRASVNGQLVSLGRGRESADNVMSTSLSIGEQPPVTLQFRDSLRPDVTETIERLKQLGISSSIATGDRACAVAEATRGLGLTAQTSMTPQDKLALIARLQCQGHKVLMVGDGLNDGPALAAGHVSMAPGSASDVGQNAADAVFLGDSLASVAKAVVAARRAMSVVRQNFVIAIVYNLVAVPLAFMGMVTPLVAALAMSGSSIIVVGNSLRLRSAAR